MKKIFTIWIGFLLTGSLQAQTGLQFADGLVHGIYRTYLLYVPLSYVPGKAVPLLISLHGFTESGEYQNSLANFRPIADTANFIIAMPDGQPNPQMYNYIGWNIFPISSGVDDPGFLKKLIDKLSTEYSIDANRVYFTGHSSGAIMSYELACSMSDRIAAIAPVNGFMFPSFVSSCSPKHPVPVIEIHGTADPVRNWNGEGPVTQAVNMDTLISYWVRFNGCSPVPKLDTLPNINTSDFSWVQHYTYSGGRFGSSVELYKVINGGHTWPGSSVLEPYGNTNKDFNACAVIWRFLSKYRLNRLNNIDEIQTAAEPFLVFPSPVNNVLTIQAMGSAAIRKIQIYTILGQEMLQINDPVTPKSVSLDTSIWEKGIYVIRVTDGTNSFPYRVIK
jgi:polyhydroxybutyrate depolymerase